MFEVSCSCKVFNLTQWRPLHLTREARAAAHHSPTRISRLQERQQLWDLNDRLVVYKGRLARGRHPTLNFLVHLRMFLLFVGAQILINLGCYSLTQCHDLFQLPPGPPHWRKKQQHLDLNDYLDASTKFDVWYPKAKRYTCSLTSGKNIRAGRSSLERPICDRASRPTEVLE